MYEEMLKNANAQFGELLAPARKLNALLLDNAEKLSSFQLEAMRSYLDLSLSQVRGALEVNDIQSLQAYVGNQSKVAETFGQKLSEDASNLAHMGKEFGAEVQKLAQENVAVFSQATQNVQQKAASVAKAPIAAARKTA